MVLKAFRRTLPTLRSWRSNSVDIKEKAEELVEKIRNNPKMLSEFKENPVSVVEAIVGMDLPDDQIRQLAELVKAKIDLDKVGDLLGGLGGLFKK